MKLTRHNRQRFTGAAAEFGIGVSDFITEIDIAGSPERSELRIVAADHKNMLYVLECVFDEDVENKKEIASYLNFFFDQKMPGINPYLRSVDNSHLAFIDERFWMMSPYIDGVALKRPDYVFDKWRGKTLADFLLTLKANSGDLLKKNKKKPFSIESYIYKLLKDIKDNDPHVISVIKPVIDFLERDFMDQHDSLPLSFCHGDYHPVNIIWGKGCINAVIDWEFSGIKPELYDLANLLGCLGMENPDCLGGELVIDLIFSLNSTVYMESTSWNNIVSFIVAIRFAWLSEWLRRGDTEMIELETLYMKILIENHEKLAEIWRL